MYLLVNFIKLIGILWHFGKYEVIIMNVEIFDSSNHLWLQILQQLRHDVYHLPQYISLESKRFHALPEAILISEDEKLFFLPYLVRRCEFGDLAAPDIFDLVSPNGYAGILLSEAAANSPEFLELAMKELISTLRAKNVCSGFFRLHPILNENLEKIYSSEILQRSGETISVNLSLSEAEIWSQTRSDHRKDINRCKRSGLTARMVPFLPYIQEFNAIYEEVMDRVAAAKSFYFGYDYFVEYAQLGEKINLCIVELENKIISACIFTECCGIVQSYLSGTRTEFLKLSPDKLIFDYVRFWAKERGNQVVHIGGGVGAAKDNLYNFKAGFSKQTHPFFTLRLIIEKEKYDYLVELQAKYLKTKPEALLQSNFFPAYRYSV